jgi:DNA-binding SARP family transcriptional activator
MNVLHISLFGKFQAQFAGEILTELYTCKVRKLFCYLLLYRDRPHPREALASLLWDEADSDRPNRCLRKTLWQLRNTLDATKNEALSDRVLLVDPEWVQIKPEADLGLDVALFEQAFSRTQGVRGRELDSQHVQILQSAVDLYRGGLQESWYQDWYLYEREHFQHMYLIMLDKLMGYCEAHCACETGLTYGALILRCEKAHERTHRRLMRLYCLAGDRTAALRQYKRCEYALEDELGVEPAGRTVALYQQIRTDQLKRPVAVPVATDRRPAQTTCPLPEVLGQLKQVECVLADVQCQVQQNIQVMELTLNNQLNQPASIGGPSLADRQPCS